MGRNAPKPSTSRLRVGLAFVQGRKGPWLARAGKIRNGLILVGMLALRLHQNDLTQTKEIIMTILKTLNFAAMPATIRLTPEQHRRSNLIAKLIEQKALAEADQTGRELSLTRRRWVKAEDGTKHLMDTPKRLRRWWVMDAKGDCLLAVRYGSKILELERGLSAIVVGKPDKLIPTIDALISAVNAGELDPHLAKMGFGSEIKPTPK